MTKTVDSYVFYWIITISSRQMIICKIIDIFGRYYDIKKNMIIIEVFILFDSLIVIKRVIVPPTTLRIF